MFYRILRLLVSILLKVFFRKIYITGKEFLPENEAVFLAANHPMAFSDACLLACFMDRPLHFLVRGDVFKPRWRWFFDWTNQIPIYRFRDGFSNMRKNADSFQYVTQALAEKKVILIFPEGDTRLEKKAFPLQKGAARITFNAFDKHNLEEIHFVPVGVNYTNGLHFRSEVMINVAKPISTREYYDRSKNEGRQVMAELTLELEQKMEPLIVHIESSEHVDLANQIFDILEKSDGEKIWPALDNNPAQFKREKQLANRINGMSNSQLEQLAHFVDSLTQENHSFKKLFQLDGLGTICMLIIAFPVAIFGYLTHFIPFYLAKYITKTKVRQREFVSPVRMGLMMVLFGLYYLLLIIPLWLFFKWNLIVILLILPLTAYGTVFWWEKWRLFKNEVAGYNQGKAQQLYDYLLKMESVV